MINKIIVLASNFFIPYLFLLVFIIIDFLIYGSGASSTVMYEKYRYYWIGSYILLAIIHLFLVFKYIRFVNTQIKTLILLSIAILYFYFLLRF